MEKSVKVQSKRTVLQIPLKEDLRNGVEKIALAEGFDSLQAFTRFIYTKIVKKEVSIPAVSQPVEYISEEYGRYLDRLQKEAEEAVKDGTSLTANSAEEFMKLMESDD